jgi:hypothetical protein
MLERRLSALGHRGSGGKFCPIVKAKIAALGIPACAMRNIRSAMFSLEMRLKLPDECPEYCVYGWEQSGMEGYIGDFVSGCTFTSVESEIGDST